MHSLIPCTHNVLLYVLLAYHMLYTMSSSALVDCGSLNAPTDGSIIMPSTTTGSVVMYNCNEGFNITGPAKRICQPNGQWTGDDPECERKYDHM